MDPHVSGGIFNPKNQQEMEEKNGPPWSRPNIGPQKPAKDGRLKWTRHGPGPISPPPRPPAPGGPPKQKKPGEKPKSIPSSEFLVAWVWFDCPWGRYFDNIVKSSEKLLPLQSYQV